MATNPWESFRLDGQTPISAGTAGGQYIQPVYGNFDDDGSNAFLQSLGYTGGPAYSMGMGDGSDSGRGMESGYSPQFLSWLQNSGLTLQQRGSMDKLGNNDVRAVDANGNQVGQQYQHYLGNNDAFAGGMALASLFGGAAALGAGAAAGGGGAAAGGGGLSADSLAYGTLENGAAYGGGAGDALTASSAPGFGGASFEAPTAVGSAGATGGGTGGLTADQLAYGALENSAAGSSAGGGLLGSSGGLFGSGISAGQAGQLLGAAGGLLANKGGLNSATQSTQNTIDPRIAQYLYGSGSGGLLGDVNSLYKQQLAQGGLNDLQRQGIAMQQQVLQDPNYATGFNQMRSVGSGLLGNPIAGNPFTQQGTTASQGAAMLAPRMTIPQQPSRSFATGLLGGPYGR